jgi:hypothetical protein
MDGVRDRVTEIEQLERTLVGDDGCLLSGSKPGGNGLFIGRGGIVADPVETRGNMEKAAGMHVVRQQVAAEATGTRLGRGEVSVLVRGNLQWA